MPANSRWDLIRGLKGYACICSGFRVKLQTVSVFLYCKYYQTVYFLTKQVRMLWNWHNLVLKNNKKLVKEIFILKSGEYVKYITDLNFDIYLNPFKYLSTMFRISKIC